MKINNFRGDFIDVSAKKASLTMTLFEWPENTLLT